MPYSQVWLSGHVSHFKLHDCTFHDHFVMTWDRLLRPSSFQTFVPLTSHSKPIRPLSIMRKARTYGQLQMLRLSKLQIYFGIEEGTAICGLTR